MHAALFISLYLETATQITLKTIADLQEVIACTFNFFNNIKSITVCWIKQFLYRKSTINREVKMCWKKNSMPEQWLS